MCLAQAAHSKYLGFAGIGRAVLRHQSNLTVIIAKADPHEPVMGYPLIDRKQVKVSLVDTSLRELGVEPHNQWLVFRADGANQHLGAVLEPPGLHILNWIR